MVKRMMVSGLKERGKVRECRLRVMVLGMKESGKIIRRRGMGNKHGLMGPNMRVSGLLGRKVVLGVLRRVLVPIKANGHPTKSTAKP